MIIELLGYIIAILLGTYYFILLLIANDLVTVIKAATILILIQRFIIKK